MMACCRSSDFWVSFGEHRLPVPGADVRKRLLLARAVEHRNVHWLFCQASASSKAAQSRMAREAAGDRRPKPCSSLWRPPPVT